VWAQAAGEGGRLTSVCAPGRWGSGERKLKFALRNDRSLNLLVDFRRTAHAIAALPLCPTRRLESEFEAPD